MVLEGRIDSNQGGAMAVAMVVMTMAAVVGWSKDLTPVLRTETGMGG
jgi:hypothetical protein